MDREILFRAKRIDKGEWVNGYVTRIKHSDDKGKVEIYYFNALDELGWVAECAVSAETVCQYTGLTDKNGMKIFEGDIVECRARKDGHDKYKVVWCKDYADFRIEPLDFGVQFPIADCNGKHIRCGKYSVIGNIFDNPELIGTGSISGQPGTIDASNMKGE